jgi:hypothetical protein
VAGSVAAPFALQTIDVDSPTVQVQRQQLAAILGRPLIGLINQRATMCCPAAEVVVPLMIA